MTSLSDSKTRLRRLHLSEHGFTLIELLVVILIIGILATIALTLFLAQQDKAHDASAKSNARNTISQLESCFTNEETYASCTTTATLGNPAFPVSFSGSAPSGGVLVTNETASTFMVVASAPSNTYTVTKNTDGTLSRTCAVPNGGGCSSQGSW